MIRHLAIATLAVAALGGCVSDYTYRGGAGDYYYGRPSVEYYDYGYGAPYGSVYGYPGGWSGGLNIGYGGGYGGYGGGYGGYGGYGSPYGYYGGGYPYYPPYYWHRPHRPHHPERPPPVQTNPGPIMSGPLPPVRVDNTTPRSPAYRLPRNGQQPIRPPSEGWSGRPDRADNPPRMARPMPPAVRQPAGGRAPTMVERPASPPPMSRPSRPSVAPALREREHVREVER